MNEITRRGAIGSLITGATAASILGVDGGAAPATAAAAPSPAPAAGPAACSSSPAAGIWPNLHWTKGIEGQRKADLGNGTFLNPIMAGDHPDPTILKDGADYYMTFSSFNANPGIVIWHSRDLVNWTPVTAALKTYVGSVWACDLAKHDGRYFIYIPIRGDRKHTVWVIHADRIEGPWSEPIDLEIPDNIDPCHAVGEDGSRWLFLSDGDRVRLAADGLSTAGKVEHVYDPWHYPEAWVVESFSPEGPKLARHGDYYYLITAIGGTAGPPTGHMVIAARSRSINGPWENCPHNPIVRTACASEKWWSRGHASLVEGPGGQWYAVYHGYENSYWTLGRQTLLDTVEWTADGWFRFTGGDLSKPMRKPGGGEALPHGMALSDDFSTDRMGTQWSFFEPGENERGRVSRKGGMLTLAATGTSPKDSSPLCFVVGDPAYEVEVDVEIDEGAVAGLLLFYDHQLYCGVGFNDKTFVTHQYGADRGHFLPPGGRSVRIRLTNDRNIVTYHTRSADGVWKKFPRQMEVSGYNHNVRNGFLSLRPAIYAAGQGSARFGNLVYRALA
jgi:beta-xylosidase